MAKKPVVSVSAELATGNQFSIPQIISVLEDKLKTLDHIKSTTYITSGVLDGNDLKKETKIDVLIRSFASVLSRETVYNQSAIELGLETYPAFEIAGYATKSWKHDIKHRIAVINQKDTFDKLEGYKEKISKFLSEQDQKDMLMKEMTAFITSNGL
jgi:hypothetical protein